jgi:acetyl-CoA carboxylase carboxyltransferase component
VAGLGAARVVTSHFSVMVKETAQLFVAGPPVVRAGMRQEVTKEELGGWEIHARESGAVDNTAEDEDDAMAQCRSFLSFLPSSVWETPPRSTPTDDPQRRDPELISIVPRERRRVYDMRRILGAVFDDGSFLEIGRYYGPSLVCGLARLDGFPVAVLANDPRVYAGGMTAAAAQKMTRFADLADTFHLPVVNFVDQPGFVIGVDAERAGTIRHGARALAAVYQASVPWVSIIVRKVFGVAGAAHGNAQRLNLRYAWPSGDWGSLPLEGGIEAAYRRVLEEADDPEAKRLEILESLESMRSPLRTAEAFGIEEIIDPRDTRPLLCEWVSEAYRIVPTLIGPRTRGLRP